MSGLFDLNTNTFNKQIKKPTTTTAINNSNKNNCNGNSNSHSNSNSSDNNNKILNLTLANSGHVSLACNNSIIPSRQNNCTDDNSAYTTLAANPVCTSIATNMESNITKNSVNNNNDNNISSVSVCSESSEKCNDRNNVSYTGCNNKTAALLNNSKCTSPLVSSLERASTLVLNTKTAIISGKFVALTHLNCYVVLHSATMYSNFLSLNSFFLPVSQFEWKFISFHFSFFVLRLSFQLFSILLSARL